VSRATRVPALSIRDLDVAYGDRLALRSVTFAVPTGVLFGIVGPNGGGKSTLLRAALQLVPKRRGAVDFFGSVLAAQRHRVAYVPQRESVDWDFPVSALEVVTMGLYREIGWLRPVRRRHRDLARIAMDRVGVAALADRPIGELSGGQQQRVFLARALVQDADLYLMDEPLAGVDAATEGVVLDLLATLRAEGRTVVVIHHALDTVRAHFDEALLLETEVRAVGRVDEVLTDEHLRRAYGGRLAAVAAGATVDAIPRTTLESGAKERTTPATPR